MIEAEVDRVEKMIFRCMEEVNPYEEVLEDMKRFNQEWEVKTTQ